MVQKAALRFTPAGVAVVEFTLEYDETVDQAGVPRQVKFEVPVVVMGDLAQMWQSVALSQVVAVEGFVAPMRKGSPRWRLYADHVRLVKD